MSKPINVKAKTGKVTFKEIQKEFDKNAKGKRVKAKPATPSPPKFAKGVVTFDPRDVEVTFLNTPLKPVSGGMVFDEMVRAVETSIRQQMDNDPVIYWTQKTLEGVKPMNQLEEELYNAKSTIARQEDGLARQDAYLKKLTEAAHTIGVVTEIRDGGRMTICQGASMVDVNHLVGSKVGDTVICVAETMQALSVMPGRSVTGTLTTVKAKVSATQIEIEGSGLGDGRIVRNAAEMPCEIGDRIILDPSGGTVVQNLGKPKSQLAWEQATNVSWDDIGGHEEAKKALRDAIETPVKHAEMFAKYGRKPTKGVLLFGPPGTGKTLLAKAAATALAHVHGRMDGAASGFIYIKGPELLSKWVGESEGSVRAIFAAAREHKKNHGYPALVFIDEAEAILSKRGGGSYMSQTLVPQFLAEMDGLDDSGCMLLLATNRASDLDPAVTREGRIDRKIRIGRPLQADTARIATIHLRGKPVAEEGLADLVSTILHTEPVGAIIGPSASNMITLSAFSSGAMIAGIIEEAATAALTRDIDAGVTVISGITAADIQLGVTKALMGLAALDHTDVMREIVASNPEVLKDAEKIALSPTTHPEMAN